MALLPPFLLSTFNQARICGNPLLHGYRSRSGGSSKLIRRIQSVSGRGRRINHNAGASYRASLRINDVVLAVRGTPTQGDRLSGRNAGGVRAKAADSGVRTSWYISRRKNCARLNYFKIGSSNLFKQIEIGVVPAIVWRAASSLIGVPAGTSTLPPTTMFSAEMRPAIFSKMGSLFARSGVMSRTQIPLVVPQSSSRTITSWATSTRRRVR